MSLRLLHLLKVVEALFEPCEWATGNHTDLYQLETERIASEEKFECFTTEIGRMETYVADLYARDWYRPNVPAPMLEKHEQVEVMTGLYNTLADAQEIDQNLFSGKSLILPCSPTEAP
jgi:hypothetical protein